MRRPKPTPRPKKPGLPKANYFQQVKAAIKRDLARKRALKNKVTPKGNRTITRGTGTPLRPITGSTRLTKIKQKVLNIKGKTKAFVRNAPKKVKRTRAKLKSAYRLVDTKMERKALFNKAKASVSKTVSKKAKSLKSSAKKQANFRLNKLTGTGTKGRAKMASAAKKRVSKLATRAKNKTRKLSTAARNWSAKKRAAMKKLWARNRKS
jgi:hypothetical protein